MGIRVITDDSIWQVKGFGATLKDILEPHIYSRHRRNLKELGVFFLAQLVNKEGNKLITWQQLKLLRNKSCKGKKANWFREIEQIVLKTIHGREIKNKHCLASNCLALKIKLPGISKDKRKKEQFLFQYEDENSIGYDYGKVVKKYKQEF